MNEYTFVTKSGGRITAKGYNREDARTRIRVNFPYLELLPDDDRSAEQRRIDAEIDSGKAEDRTAGWELDSLPY